MRARRALSARIAAPAGTDMSLLSAAAGFNPRDCCDSRPDYRPIAGKVRKKQFQLDLF